MKTNQTFSIFLLLLFVATAFNLSAQTNEENRKMFSEVKTKAEQNDAVAQFKLGICYGSGVGTTEDFVQAAKWLRKAAEQGIAPAQLMLGLCYSMGLGVAENDVESVKWCRKAAKQNNAQAQELLGEAYTKGEGVTKDELEAVKWYRKAAEQNNAKAQFYLGLCYHSGEGVTKDYHEAVKWLTKAADQNLASAQSSLGSCYTYGEGVEKNDTEAVKWYRKAAEQNDADAQFALGNDYGNGVGVAKDETKAAYWYEKAAKQNDADAQNNLGVYYVFGKGVVKDYVEGYKWILLAAGKGSDTAKNLMPVLEAKMTPEQIAEGQKLARNFRPRKATESNPFVFSNEAADSNPTATGTGFFITADGYLISNYHVVKGAAKVRLLTGAGMVDAKVVQVDAADDLALLKADGRFAPLPILPSKTIQLGNTVATIGFPDPGLQGFAPKLAKGEIASLSGAGDDARYFQISVPVQPGNSGGALVDGKGNVVGIVSAKLNASAALAASGALPENVNYAIKSSFLLSFLESAPGVEAELKKPNTADEKFEDVVKQAQKATVLVLVY